VIPEPKDDEAHVIGYRTKPNRVMDALNFEYPDYERLDEGMAPAEMKVQDNELVQRKIRRLKITNSKLSKALMAISGEKNYSPEYGNFLYFHVFISDFSLLCFSIPLPSNDLRTGDSKNTKIDLFSTKKEGIIQGFWT
ncbi:hypothetical protein ACJX0J_039817, partial [Zea mays]